MTPVPRYTFHELSSFDFEELVADLLDAEEGTRLERFKPGRDQGIDLRAVLAPGRTTVVQCKHMAASSVPQLLASLRKEAPKVRALAPERYVVATSLGLTPANKAAVMAELSPFVRRPGDVLGREDLNTLIARHPDIERRNFKLWLASTEVLDRIMHNAERFEAEFRVDRIRRKLSLFVPSEAYRRALDMMNRSKVAVISGAPGIGKTTLADMLLIRHLERGYEPVVIRSEIAEGKRLFNPLRRQVFYYDDFLGQTFLRDGYGYLSRNHDAELVDFMEAVQRSRGSRFVLTTREHILSKAMLASERFQQSTAFDERCVLELGDYTFGQRARILYNHLYFSDLPQAYKDEILRDEFYLKAIRHPNFNPRVVEWLSGFARVRATPAAGFQHLVEATLRNPERIWRHAFDRQVSEAARNVLLSLFGLSGSAEVGKLKGAFDVLHRHKAERYRFALAPNEFEDALRELDGAFVRIDSGTVRFINPSVKDFLAGLMAEVPDHALDLLSTASRTDQVARVWQVAGTVAGSGLRDVLVAGPALILGPLRRVLANPRAERKEDANGHSVMTHDAPWEARAALALSVAEALRSDASWTLLEQALWALPVAWRDEVPDWEGVQDLLRALEDAHWDRVSEATDLHGHIKAEFISQFCYANSSDFASVVEHADLSSRWTDADWGSLREAFSDYLRTGFGDDQTNQSGSEELSRMREDITTVADRLGVSVTRQTETLDQDIAERAAEEEWATTLEDGPKSGRGTSVIDDVGQVRRMFGTLRGT